VVGNLKVLIRELTIKLILTVKLNDTLLLGPHNTHHSFHFAVGHSIYSQPASQLTKAVYLITPTKGPTLNYLRHLRTLYYNKGQEGGQVPRRRVTQIYGVKVEVFNTTILPVNAYSHIPGEKELNLNQLKHHNNVGVVLKT
jgi:hypothetical protein